jgi:beta-glucosidase
MVGIAHNMIDFGPARKWHPIEVIVSEMFKSFYNRSWLDAITGRKQHFGVIGVVPKAKEVPEALGRMTADYIGINYYTKGRVQWRPKVANPEASAPVPIGLAFADEGDTVSDLGWAIHPQGFQKMIDLAASYGLPIYITENGIACENDKLRERYIQEHLDVVDQSRKKGVDLRGYYHWSLLDNFEWIKGFGPRFGLYRVNYETMERTPNPSALKLKERIKTPRPS